MNLDTKNLKNTSGMGFGEFNEAMDSYDSPMFVSFGMVPHNHDFAYIVHGEIYDDFCSRIARLENVRQLGLTTASGEYAFTDHTRFLHSLVMAVMAERVLARNGFSEEVVNLGIASSILHDMATPPFSDYGMLGAGAALDEERAIELFREDRELQSTLGKYRMSWPDVVSCIRGEHPALGRLVNSNDSLDIDGVSYVAMDAAKIYGNRPDGGIAPYLQRPHLFDLHEDIVFHDGKPVFSDPDKTADFLAARALMFRDVYYSPQNRAREAFLERELRRLWKEGVLKAERMVSMTDNGFRVLLEGNIPAGLYRAIFLDFYAFEETRRMPADRLSEAGVESSGPDCVVYHKPPFKPKTRTPVMVRGIPAPLEDALPEAATLIKETARACDYVGVYRLKG